jgi:hypothetical protein
VSFLAGMLGHVVQRFIRFRPNPDVLELVPHGAAQRRWAAMY